MATYQNAMLYLLHNKSISNKIIVNQFPMIYSKRLTLYGWEMNQRAYKLLCESTKYNLNNFLLVNNVFCLKHLEL